MSITQNFLVSTSLLFCCLMPVRLQAAEISFQRDVRPILSNTCFKCHGPDSEQREADLRLDDPADAMADRGGYRAIVPGDPDASEVIARLNTDDRDLLMPPADSGLALTEKQIQTLHEWIRAGAAFEPHWSFSPVVRPEVPGPDASGWGRNSIDRFVRARLSAAGLTPSPEADRTTLIRRVHLDTVGLLPDPDEVAQFIEDRSDNAYEAMADRALASPHYGERWGRHWLDQARYADTNGYTIDSERSIWPYRDWVIDALNRDMPFDQFTIEQLAGDLLPGATLAQRVATGFHRNTLVNQEGGSDREQFRNEAVMDRANTTGAVWLGLTVGCAQCHNHKYDPISQQDYYQLFAFFNSGQDVNSVSPTVRVPTPDQQQQLKELEDQVAAARAELEQYERQQNAQRPEHERDDGKPIAWTVLTAQSFESDAGAVSESLDDGSILVGGDNGDQDTYRVTVAVPSKAITALRLEVLTHPRLPNGGPGRAGNGNFVLNEIQLLNAGGQPAKWLHATADHSQKDYPITAAIDGDSDSGWAINVDGGRLNVGRTAQFILAERAGVDREQPLQVVMRFAARPPKYNIGRFRLAVTDAVHAKLDIPDPERAGLAAELKRREQARDRASTGIPSTMVMVELDQPRPSYVLIRGDFLRHGDPVQPDVPASLPPMAPSGERRTRLDLARWLVDRNNPLTARVAVNRIWMRYFGRGLVQTENDFGIQGSLPTHPELLDWLAAEFMDSGWSMKHVHRLILTSATYRQSSNARPDLESADPLNELLARQARLRVEAEIVRDLALTASGLLSRRIGGPSVYPPQPSGVYAFTQRKAGWPTSTGEDRFRRGMYTFFMRSAPYPMLTTFDTPRFNKVCTRRTRSNTPLQSLTLANDEAMVEIARALAMRVISTGPSEDAARIDRAFRLCLTRSPDDRERARLLRYLQDQLLSFTADANQATELAGGDLPKGIEAVEAAAWVAVARVLFNLDEFITRE